MSLSDLASLGSFVSGVAVLASLVFLFFQMRQMTEQVRQSEKNQQALISQVRSTRTVEITMSAMQTAAASEEFAETMLKVNRGEEDIPAQRLQPHFLYWRANLHGWQDAFYQHADGLLTETAFNNVRLSVRSIVSGVFGLRIMWRLNRGAFGPEFVAWMDKLVAETPNLPFPLADRWREAVAAERLSQARHN
jgi:hypothetical protein